MAEIVTVAFACNDARNGSFVGHFEAVELDAFPSGHHLSAEGRRQKIVFDGRGKDLLVGRKRFEGDCRRRWEGNWCWDSVDMQLSEAKRLLAHLIGVGWQINE